VLIVAERTGRAIRNPARDAMLAHATRELGSGWVFGVREALDAGGAMLGPLIVSAVIYFHGGYRTGFAVLAVPALLTLVVLGAARREYPRPAELEAGYAAPARTGIPRVFWIYLAGMALIAAAYADFPLIAYHFQKARVLSSVWIPVLYAVAMATEAAAALVLGRLYDRVGLLTVVGSTVLTAFFAPLVFLGGAALAVVGMVLWGLGMAAQESIVKAAITGMVAPDRRASAYGLFDTGFGVCWFLGSIALGLLYERSVTAVAIFSVVLQLAALPFLIWTRRSLRNLAAG
jgi:predicted MFS family arabinose efflux permease